MSPLISLSTFALLLVACAAPSPPDDGGRADEEAARAAEITRAEPLPAPGSPGEAQPDDLPPCPGINPDIRRPAGSNCLGITPDQCGADKAQAYVGQKGTPELREQLTALAKSTANGNFRWIPHNTAVIQDLRPHRFNVELDEDGVIARIDCY